MLSTSKTISLCDWNQTSNQCPGVLNNNLALAVEWLSKIKERRKKKEGGVEWREMGRREAVGNTKIHNTLRKDIKYYKYTNTLTTE